MGDRYNWDLKYLTEDCKQCGCYVNPHVAAGVLIEVGLRKGRRKWMIPSSQQGLCTWGNPDYNKVLVRNRRRPPKKCQYFGETREEYRQERGYPQNDSLLRLIFDIIEVWPRRN